MFAKVKSLFTRKPATLAHTFHTAITELPAQPAKSVEPKDRVEVPVGIGLGKAVVQRGYSDGRVSLSYVSNYGAGYNAGPITLSVNEWDELVEAVEAVLAEKPSVEVPFL